MKRITITLVMLFIGVITLNAQAKFNRNIPQAAHVAIGNQLKSGISVFTVAPNGGWVVISENGKMEHSKIPAECVKKTKEFLAKGHKIKDIAFPPKGGNSWVILTNKAMFARNIPDECYKRLLSGYKKGNKAVKVSFPPKGGNSWVIVNENGSTFSRNIDDECYQILRNLRESDMPGKKASRKITSVTFAPNGGFVVLAEDYHFARNIDKECFAKMNAFKKGNNLIKTVAFAPKGKGWSVISNGKSTKKPKDRIRDFENNVAGNSIWEVMRELDVPSLSVGVVINGKLAWSTAYGHLKNNNRKHAAHPESMYQAASVSKVLAAIGAFKMVESYPTIQLNDNLRDKNSPLSFKIPIHPSNTSLKGIGNISIKTILQHKSGLNKQGYGGYKSAVSSVPSLDEILVAKSKPGKVGVNSSSITLRYSDNKNRYSGAAFTVLQKLTEDITKANYARWMQNNVLNTMGMRQSSFTIEPEKRYKQENLSYAYGKNEIYRHPEFAAAGLYTNVNELANMIITINNSGRFKGRTVISNSSAFSISNGIGAKRSDGNIKASNNFYCHGGINKGYRAFFIGFRKMSGDSGINDSGIVLLTNVPKTKFRYDVVNAVIKAYGW